MVAGTVCLLGAAMFAAPAQASTVTLGGTTCLTAAGTGPDGRPVAAGTATQDGSGAYSLVGGCSAQGNGLVGVTGFGSYSSVTGNGGAAFGFSAKAGTFATAVGLYANANAASAVAIGYNATASVNNSTAVGAGAQAAGPGAAALGGSSVASADSALAVGASAKATVGAATAIGVAANATGFRSTALGAVAQAAQDHSVAIGDGGSARR